MLSWRSRLGSQARETGTSNLVSLQYGCARWLGFTTIELVYTLHSSVYRHTLVECLWCCNLAWSIPHTFFTPCHILAYWLILFFALYYIQHYIKFILSCLSYLSLPLHWRHNGHGGVSNHQPRGCLLNHLFRRRSKKTSKLRVTGLCAGHSPGPVNSPHKGPVTRKMFPFDDAIMLPHIYSQGSKVVMEYQNLVCYVLSLSW